MNYFALNNGTKMPMAGLGVFLLSPAETEVSIKSALADGFRLIDTANAYMNEKDTGRAIKASGVAREEIYLVSKLWPAVYEQENAVEETLKRLDTEYVDLLFLHQPSGNWKAGYKLIEKAYKEGKVKAIGLSNFEIEDVKWVLENAEIKPQTVQVEAHPYFPQTELKKVLAETNMGLMAWFPLGHGDVALREEPIFTELGKKYGKSNAQIILRWHTQVGNVVIPGSKNPDHIRENFNIFDFELTADEMASIATLDKNEKYFHATQEQLDSYAAMAIPFDTQE